MTPAEPPSPRPPESGYSSASAVHAAGAFRAGPAWRSGYAVAVFTAPLMIVVVGGMLALFKLRRWT